MRFNSVLVCSRDNMIGISRNYKPLLEWVITMNTRRKAPGPKTAGDRTRTGSARARGNGDKSQEVPSTKRRKNVQFITSRASFVAEPSEAATAEVEALPKQESADLKRSKDEIRKANNTPNTESTLTTTSQTMIRWGNHSASV